MASKRKPEEAVTPIEIRERVAREVMGLRDVQRIGVLSPDVVFDNGMTIQSVPEYPTDIAAAFQVVEEMRKRGLGLQLGPSTGGWWAKFVSLSDDADDDDEGPECHAPKAPVAISLAALAALEAK